jgi:large subunit ribosomal protein L10
MAITRQKKEDILKELVDKFGKSKSVVFANYRGLDVAGISDLRRRLNENDAEMKVAKKTLISLAAKESKIEIDPSSMEGPIAATFSYKDPLSGIQALFKFSKENDKLKLLGGVIDGVPVGPEVIEKYAKLPSHEELFAKFIGSMQSPVSGFVGILGNVLGGFVRAISAYKDTLPAEEPKIEEPAPVEEPKEETTHEAPKEEEKPAEETPTEGGKTTESTEEPTPESEPETPAEGGETAEPAEEKTEETPAEPEAEVKEETPAEGGETAEPAEEKPEPEAEVKEETPVKSDEAEGEAQVEEEEKKEE